MVIYQTVNRVFSWRQDDIGTQPGTIVCLAMTGDLCVFVTTEGGATGM